MNILYIWDADYPWDVRVEKICKSLVKNGHSVHIASRNLKKKLIYEKSNGLHIHRLKPFKNDKINYIASFPAFFSPIWKKFLDFMIEENDINLIIVRDLPLAIAGLWAGRRHNCKVVFDMAEDYVSMVKEIWRTRKFQNVNLVVRNPYLAKLVEKYAIKRMDHVLVVVEEAVNVVIRGGGCHERVTIVGNTPPKNSLHLNKENVVSCQKLIKSRFTAIYTGGIQMGRGIQTVFNAIPLIVRTIPDFLFVVVGAGYASEKLKNMIHERKLENQVLWVGWVDHMEIFNYIGISKIGLIPHLVSDHVATTIPNKIFDYMAMGLPVIASDAPPMKRILTEGKCGLTFKSGDAEDLSRAIVEVKASNIDYGNNGKQAVRTKYNWSEDEKSLINVVNMFDS